MTVKVKDDKNDQAIRQLFEAGAHFGYSRSRRHPSVQSYIYGFKNRVAIVDLRQVVTALEKAKNFLSSLAANNQTVLWVGTKNEARAFVQVAAEDLNQPYVIGRWLGGTLTNFSQLQKRLGRLSDLKTKKDKGELSIYTKKEQLLIDREIADLERRFGTIASLKHLPATVVVIDSRAEDLAVREARQMKIPVVSLSGTDCNLVGINFPVVGNDAGRASIKYFVDQLATAYRAGKMTPPVVAPAV
ncbi:MAG: 30S ribosomal protein S2 [Patescibacteria group bacterium]